MTSKEFETQEVLQRRSKLSKEINSFKVDIDRSVFTKTPQEKLDLKQAKSDWKKSQITK